jgi:hypothetical protein
MRRFEGYRPNPPAEYVAQGITNSGTSTDYEGVVFSDGTVVVRWQTQYRSHSVWASWEDFYQVHGHPEYETEIRWLDGETVDPTQGDRARRDAIRAEYSDEEADVEKPPVIGYAAKRVSTFPSTDDQPEAEYGPTPPAPGGSVR